MMAKIDEEDFDLHTRMARKITQVLQIKVSLDILGQTKHHCSLAYEATAATFPHDGVGLWTTYG